MTTFRRWRNAFAEPLLLFALTLGGLIAALLGSPSLKVVGVAAVTGPIIAVARHGVRAIRSERNTS